MSRDTRPHYTPLKIILMYSVPRTEPRPIPPQGSEQWTHAILRVRPLIGARIPSAAIPALAALSEAFPRHAAASNSMNRSVGSVIEVNCGVVRTCSTVIGSPAGTLLCTHSTIVVVP